MIKDTSATDTAVETQSNKKRNIVILVVASLIVAFAANAFLRAPSASRSIDRASVQLARVEIGLLCAPLSMQDLLTP